MIRIVSERFFRRTAFSPLITTSCTSAIEKMKEIEVPLVAKMSVPSASDVAIVIHRRRLTFDIGC